MPPLAATLAAVVASPLSLLKPENILSDAGGIAIWVAALIVFAECGLLIGFFLPGDSLLFVVGLFVGNGAIGVPLWETVLILFVAAFAGNLLGYWIGRRAGPAIFRRDDSRLFKRKYIDHTEEFFNRYGAAAVILGRFIAIVRTFITVLAGAGNMDARRFAAYSAIGAFLWVTSMTVLGYLIGNVPAVKNNLDVAILVIVAVSLVPIAVHRLKARRARA